MLSMPNDNSPSLRVKENRIICGDSREILPTIQTMSVDLVLTDPPYSINSKSDGQGKLSPWADYMNSAMFYEFWLRECKRILKPTGALWSFLNWRSFPVFAKASCEVRWPMESVLVWDKKWIGPGGPNGLRPSYELVALWAGPEFSIADRSLCDIKRCLWASAKPFHPAEKPVKLLRWLLEISGGQSVLDIFAGSGSVGVACVELGRDFVGIELDSGYAEVARRRIEAAVRQQRLEFGAGASAPLRVQRPTGDLLESLGEHGSDGTDK
jgi:site-specific DNA-methyltransferase (adenine-specific)